MIRDRLGALTLASSTIAASVAIAGCATAPRPIEPSTIRPPTTADAMRHADALVRAGCLDCLSEAYGLYDRLAAESQGHPGAARGAVEAALLVAARERELGLDDSGATDLARRHLSKLPAADRDVLALTIDVVDALPGGGPAGGLTSDRDVARRATAVRRRDEFRVFLEAHADDSPLLAYTWLSFACAYRGASDDSVATVSQRSPTWRDTTLLAYRMATCRGSDRPVLRALLTANPRFVELRYFIGRLAVDDGFIDEGIDEWEQASAWRPRWPALTQALADAYLGIDEYERALECYERTLAQADALPAALLGKARALTYLARHDAALGVLDQLLAANGWYVADAYYWRALNETQLERYPAAWDDIERASSLFVSADVSKLAGIIAHRLGRSEIARNRFEEAWRRNRTDCEVGVHLSIVQSGLRAWAGALEALGRTATCLESAERQLAGEIERIRSVAEPPATPAAAARQAREIADREARIATGKRLLATVWFNSAVASYYSARMDDARSFAERVLADDEFGAAARTLLARLP